MFLKNVFFRRDKPKAKDTKRLKVKYRKMFKMQVTKS